MQVFASSLPTELSYNRAMKTHIGLSLSGHIDFLDMLREGARLCRKGEQKGPSDNKTNEQSTIATHIGVSICDMIRSIEAKVGVYQN